MADAAGAPELLEGRYRLISRLSAGGFGSVWLAQDERLHKLCALKQSHAQSPDLAQAMESEARILAHLSHPGLPHIHDHFLLDGQACLVMEYIEGVDLAGLLAYESAGVAPARVVEWMVALCDAVHYLHSRSTPVIHRDIKPANIKLTSGGRVVLVDFGIASSTSGPNAPAQHAITPGYSPPEQYSGQADGRADVYALGATCYALLTGQAPLPAHERVAGAALLAPSQLRPAVPAAFDRPVMLALDLAPARRIQSAQALASALLGALQQSLPDSSPPPAPSPEQRRPGGGGRSRRWMIGLGLVVALALLAAGIRALAAQFDGSPLAVARHPDATRPASATGDPPVGAAPPATARPGATPAPAPPRAPILLEGAAGAVYVAEKGADGLYQIYRAPLDGGPVAQLTSAGSNYGAQVSPDGATIVFTSERDGRERVYLMDADGSNQRPLSDAGAVAQHPAWSPDGGALVYARNLDLRADDNAPGWQIVAQQPSSAETRVLSAEWAIWPRWGAGGIVYTTRQVIGATVQFDLKLIQPDGTGLRALAAQPDIDEHYADWSPDGRRVAYVAGAHSSLESRQLWVLDVASGQQARLTASAGGVAMPAWSPDGQRIAFLAHWAGSAQFNIWAVSAAGGDARALTVNPEAKFALDWTP